MQGGGTRASGWEEGGASLFHHPILSPQPTQRPEGSLNRGGEKGGFAKAAFSFAHAQHRHCKNEKDDFGKMKANFAALLKS